MIAAPPKLPRQRTRAEIDHEAELWQRYTRHRTLTNRNVLVSYYKRFAWHLIRQYEQGGHLPPQLTTDDISGAVMAALVWCVERFRPNSGAVFTTYARRRLQGAIIDEQRRWGALDGYSRVCGRLAHLTSYDAMLDRHGDEQTNAHPREVLTDDHAHEAAGFVDAIDTIEAVVALLPPKYRAMMRWRHIHGLQMREIGRRLGVCEARVSQMHTDALKLLRGRLRDQVEAAAGTGAAA